MMGWDGGGWVVDCSWLWVPFLTGSSGGQVFLVGLLRASMPTASLLVSTGLFESKVCSFGDFPPGSQGPCPSQVDRTSSCDGSRGDLSTSRAAMALSALPAGSTPAVPSARAGTAPTTGNSSPRSCASKLAGSTSPPCCDSHPEQLSGSTMMTPRLGHGSGRV